MNSPLWWSAKVPMEERWKSVLDYVRRLETVQKPQHERNLRYARLYDRHCRLMGTYGQVQDGVGGDPITDNLVKSNIDTVTSMIAKNRPRIAIITAGAEWSVQRRAKWLERYIEAQFQRCELYVTMVDIFRDACVFGTGALKLYLEDGQIVAERTIPDELIVDEEECRAATPRQLHQRRFVDREVLKAFYPDFEAEIDAAHSDSRNWTIFRKLEPSQIAVVESWRLPSNSRSGDGRHTISIDGATLVDEPYTRRVFPFVFYRWTKRITGFLGCGLAEELCGPQLTVNRINADIRKGLRRIAVPRIFVNKADAALKIRIDDEIGGIIPYAGRTPPTAATWQAFGRETYDYLENVKVSAQRYSGISEMSSQAKKPVGLDSGAALREWTDIESQRFSIQTQFLEQSYLEAARHIVELSKELYKSNPKASAVWHSRNLAKRIPWKDVDLEEDIYAMRIEASSILSLTPAGRRQAAQELVQSGMVRPEVALRLTGIPDVEREIDIGTAALEDIEAELEELLDGRWRPPEPFQALQLGIDRMVLGYLKARRDGAPDDILELVRRWVEGAMDLLPQAQVQPPSPGQAVVPFQAGIAAPAGPPAPGGAPPPTPPGAPPQQLAA